MLLKSICALILDMDGVLWKDNVPIGNLPAIFRRLEKAGLKTILATNNSTRSVEQYLQKVADFGVELQPWQIITSSQAAARLLQEKFPQGGFIFIIGEDALKNTLAEAGYFHRETDVLAVVAGMDRSINYQKLRIATLLIRQGAPFIATNPDRTFPTPEGLVPGTGAILASIEAATDVSPEIAGKPYPHMYLLALERLGIPRSQTLVVGDRLETDIAGAQKLGLQTALVLSGVTNPQQANNWNPAPDLIADDLTQIVDLITEAKKDG